MSASSQQTRRRDVRRCDEGDRVPVVDDGEVRRSRRDEIHRHGRVDARHARERKAVGGTQAREHRAQEAAGRRGERRDAQRCGGVGVGGAEVLEAFESIEELAALGGEGAAALGEQDPRPRRSSRAVPRSRSSFLTCCDTADGV